MTKIPVTVITGFLGAGKTTLVRHLLQNNQGQRIAVLVNEFGEIGIDGELLRACQVCYDETDSTSNPGNQIIELTNGCLCCTVQEEFYPVMQTLLQRREALDCIVIETSGLALPKPLVQAFRWPDIRQYATVDGVITVVDSQALAQGQLVGDLAALLQQRQADPNLDHETPLEELFEDQLACADLVLLTKTDLLQKPQRQTVENWLKQKLRPGIKTIPCQRGVINPDILLGFQAAVEEHLSGRPSHHDHEEEHDHDDGIQSTQFISDQGHHPPALLDQLQHLVQQQEIYRIKGFVSVPNKPMRLVIQGVGANLDSFYDRRWQANEARQTRLVFIGRNLDAQAIQASLASIAISDII